MKKTNKKPTSPAVTNGMNSGGKTEKLLDVSSNEEKCFQEVLNFGSLPFGRFGIYKQTCLVHGDHTSQ